MDWWQALVLGLVEGLTEYLPVSSTGHLLLTQRLMGIGQTEVSDAFAISVQGGAIVAVLGLYFRRVRQMAFGVFGKDPEGARLAAAVVAAFLPAAVVLDFFPGFAHLRLEFVQDQINGRIHVLAFRIGRNMEILAHQDNLGHVPVLLHGKVHGKLGLGFLGQIFGDF